jgi:hypothetical protein
MTDDKAVIATIRDGFRKLCDHAKAKHRSGAYGPPEHDQQFWFEHWCQVERRGLELIDTLKKTSRAPSLAADARPVTTQPR